MELEQRRKQRNLAQYPQVLKASFSSCKDLLPVETPLSLHLPLRESLENVPLRHFNVEVLLTKWIAPTCNIVGMILVTLYATVYSTGAYGLVLKVTVLVYGPFHTTVCCPKPGLQPCNGVSKVGHALGQWDGLII